MRVSSRPWRDFEDSSPSCSSLVCSCSICSIPCRKVSSDRVIYASAVFGSSFKEMARDLSRSESLMWSASSSRRSAFVGMFFFFLDDVGG